MNEVVYCGLKLSTECSYFYVYEGSTASIVHDKSKSLLTIIYPKDSTSTSISNLLSIELIEADRKLEPMNRPEPIRKVIVSINGLEFIKTNYESHVFRIILVSDHESRVAQEYDHTTIVLNSSDKSDKNFIKYLFSNLKFLKLVNKKFDFSNYEVFNFPRITIYNKSLTLTSDNSYVHKLRNSYDKYLIRSIDYEDKFFEELGTILNNYGLELTRRNREKTLKNTSYVSYSIPQTPVKYLHPRSWDVHDSVLAHRVPIEFQLRTPDMILFFDFKNRYNNVDLLTNFTEFLTRDRYGEEWRAAVKWGYLTEDFDQNYSTDDNSNFSHQCSFRCELYFYEVYDNRFNYIEEIITELCHVGLYEENYDTIQGETTYYTGLNE
jgi:hypothetical protein